VNTCNMVGKGEGGGRFDSDLYIKQRALHRPYKRCCRVSFQQPVNSSGILQKIWNWGGGGCEGEKIVRLEGVEGGSSPL
jgi:hypothetical protein